MMLGAQASTVAISPLELGYAIGAGAGDQAAQCQGGSATYFGHTGAEVCSVYACDATLAARANWGDLSVTLTPVLVSVTELAVTCQLQYQGGAPYGYATFYQTYTCPTGYFDPSGVGLYCVPKGSPSAPPPEKNAGTPALACGNPINPAIGSKFESVSDFGGISDSLLSFQRNYNSVALASPRHTATIGARWKHVYDRSVVVQQSSAYLTAYVQRPDGKVFYFTQNGSNWIADSDVPDKLIQSTSSGTATPPASE